MGTNDISIEGEWPSILPDAAVRLLRFIVPDAEADPILGDLAEMLEDSGLSQISPRKAKLWCWFQILCAVGVFVWIHLGRGARALRPDMQSARCIGQAVAEYYFSVVLFYLFLQLSLPVLMPGTNASAFCGFGISNGLLFWGSKCAEAVAQSRDTFLRCWQDTVAAAIVVLIAIFVARHAKGRLGRLAAYLVVAASSYRLIPFVISLLVSGDGWWSLYSSWPTEASALRFLFMFTALGLILTGIYCSLRRLSTGYTCRPSGARAGLFLYRTLFPALFVSLLFETAFFRQWNLWFLEYRLLTLLPVIVVGILFMLFVGRVAVPNIAD